jgi:hypothetical protein
MSLQTQLYRKVDSHSVTKSNLPHLTVSWWGFCGGSGGVPPDVLNRIQIISIVRERGIRGFGLSLPLICHTRMFRKRVTYVLQFAATLSQTSCMSNHRESDATLLRSSSQPSVDQALEDTPLKRL